TMCQLVVYEACICNNQVVCRDIIRILGGIEKCQQYIFSPVATTTDNGGQQQQGTDKITLNITPEQLCNHILHTIYIGTENSSTITRQRAETLASNIQATHYSFNIDVVIKALLSVFTTVFPKHTPKYHCYGGNYQTDIALQNIQARIRMVISYLF